ncbi:MAG: hypothetical protein BWY16_00733 [Candidatus Omnitrophica bacterium ADurb.Bin205]|nr:MAG: hypothetical protein BWY16_00733 [Candidatus Omnitrophica bacterium ADurb.Bin205]
MKRGIKRTLFILLVSVTLGLIICFILGDIPVNNPNQSTADEITLPHNKESLRDMAKGMGLSESDIKAARSILNSLNK